MVRTREEGGVFGGAAETQKRQWRRQVPAVLDPCCCWCGPRAGTVPQAPPLSTQLKSAGGGGGGGETGKCPSFQQRSSCEHFFAPCQFVLRRSLRLDAHTHMHHTPTHVICPRPLEVMSRALSAQEGAEGWQQAKLLCWVWVGKRDGGFALSSAPCRDARHSARCTTRSPVPHPALPLPLPIPRCLFWASPDAGACLASVVAAAHMRAALRRLSGGSRECAAVAARCTRCAVPCIYSCRALDGAPAAPSAAAADPCPAPHPRKFAHPPPRPHRLPHSFRGIYISPSRIDMAGPIGQ